MTSPQDTREPYDWSGSNAPRGTDLSDFVPPKPECDHLWTYLGSQASIRKVLETGKRHEYFYCQRDPTHRLVLVDGKVRG